jgi:hypothetical protein
MMVMFVTAAWFTVFYVFITYTLYMGHRHLRLSKVPPICVGQSQEEERKRKPVEEKALEMSSNRGDVDEQPVQSASQQPRKKTRRAGQACDRCRSRKIKVRQSRAPEIHAAPPAASSYSFVLALTLSLV